MGKSSGGSGDAAAREAKRKADQFALDKDIRSNFFQPGTDTPTAARTAQFGDIEQRVRNRFIPDFNELTSDANRELKFAIGRRGLFSGSAETEAQSRLARRVTKGEDEIALRVLGARSAKENADRSLMTTLFNQSAAGGNRDVVLGGINSGLQAATNNAVQQATIQAIENPFQDVGSLFKNVNNNSQFVAGGNSQAARLAQLFSGSRGRIPAGSSGIIS